MDLSGDGSITLDRRAFKALASVTRVEILKRLDGTQKTVSDLARELDMNKATMFQHLEQLVEVGLVKKDSEEDRATTVKEGPNEAPVSGPPKKWVYYRLSWKGKNVLHPERVRIAIMLSITAVSCVLVALIYVMTLQATGPGAPDEKDTRAPLVVGWNVESVRTDTGIVNVQLTVADNLTGKVSGLDENATVLRWGISSDPVLGDPDIMPWTGLDYTVQGGVLRAYIPAIDWSFRAGKYLVVSVELKDLAGNGASYRFLERVAPASGPDLRIPSGGITFARMGSGHYQFGLLVRLENAGSSNATNVTISVFARDPDPTRTGKVTQSALLVATGRAAAIGAGEYVTVDLTVNARGLPSRNIYIMVDPDDTVTETNEADNVMPAIVPAAIYEGAKSSPAAMTPGMGLAAVALALGIVVMLARRRMRDDGR